VAAADREFVKLENEREERRVEAEAGLKRIQDYFNEERDKELRAHLARITKDRGGLKTQSEFTACAACNSTVYAAGVYCAESRKLKHSRDLRLAREVPRPQFSFPCQALSEPRSLRLRGVRVLAC
jgi:hypothetical protein